MGKAIHPEEKKVGTILIVPIGSFFSEYMKEQKGQLKDYEIIIISKDIVSDIRSRTSNVNQYESRFKYVDFAVNLFPDQGVQEYYYGGQRDTFNQLYATQLGKVENMTDLCSIVDLVVNEGKNVIILFSNAEYKAEYYQYLKDFVYVSFGLIMTAYEDYVADHNAIHDIGDVKKIRELLEFQLQNNDIIDEAINIFVNKYAEDLVGEYRDILMSKTMDQLKEIGLKHNVYINKLRPKEYNVDNILQAMFGDEVPWSKD